MDKQKMPTGNATVTYENPESAARAIESEWKNMDESYKWVFLSVQR